MTALTVTVSDELDFNDTVKIKIALEALTSTDTNDRFIVIPSTNGRSRVVKMSIA